MSPLPQIRVNTQVPFPAMVTASGPIVLSKNTGIWNIGFSILPFATQTPPSANWPLDFLFGYDANINAFFKISLSELITLITPPTPIPVQRLVTASGFSILTTDAIINVNISSGTPSVTLPSAASRTGASLTFKDVGGHFAAAPLTITPAAGDNIDGGGAITLGTNYQSIKLVPANDGTTVGWSIE